MKYFTIGVDEALLKDFDVVAKLNNRNRTYQIREMILDAVKKTHKKNPEAFKK